MGPKYSVPYDLGEKIGSGQFGTVYTARHKKTKEIVAIKKVVKEISDSETKTLKKASHQNIVKLIDYFIYTRETWIVLEFCDFGSLDKYLKIHQPSLEERMKLIQQMCSGLAHLHDIPIIHRDLKPANVLVDKDRVAKLSDFGVAKFFYDDGNIYLKSNAGTLAYIAPEIMAGHYNLKADIFSLGLLFCDTLSDNLEGTKCWGVVMHTDKQYKFIPPANLSDFMQTLITDMMERDYHARPNANEVLRQLFLHNTTINMVNSANSSSFTTRVKGNVESKLLTKNDIVGGYKILNDLGSGSFADVYRAFDTSTNETIALKRFKEAQLDFDDILVEIASLQIATHRNVVGYLNSFVDENTMYVVMEYCEFGDIDNFIKTRRPDDKRRMGFVQDIAAGIAHLHSVKIVHRDLKPANILISNQCVAKLADFGLAKILAKSEGEKKIENIYMQTFAGTFVYMAPEVFKEHYNAQADIFSMGMVFCGILDDELKVNIQNELIGFKMYKVPGYRYLVPDSIGNLMQGLVNKMLEEDFHLRPKANDICRQLNQQKQKSGKVKWNSKRLLAAGISACLGVRVLQPGEAPSQASTINIKKITIHDLFHFTNPEMFKDLKQANSEIGEEMIAHDDIAVMFKSIGGSSGKIKISKKARVSEMRQLIASKQCTVSQEFIELYYKKCSIDDDKTLETEGIGDGSVVHLHSSIKDQKGVVYYEMDKSLLDPQFNHDFTNTDDGSKQFIRGGHVYHRPCGWFRHALKVKGEYENSTWLGKIGNRTQSTPHEWPVCYHGSKMLSDKLPIEASASSLVASGIVTTPSLELVAQKFAETFQFEGNTYQIALQNRINPELGHMKVINDGHDEYWLSPKQDIPKAVYDVRPYGILIRKI